MKSTKQQQELKKKILEIAKEMTPRQRAKLRAEIVALKQQTVARRVRECCHTPVNDEPGCPECDGRPEIYK